MYFTKEKIIIKDGPVVTNSRHTRSYTKDHTGPYCSAIERRQKEIEKLHFQDQHIDILRPKAWEILCVEASAVGAIRTERKKTEHTKKAKKKSVLENLFERRPLPSSNVIYTGEYNYKNNNTFFSTSQEHFTHWKNTVTLTKQKTVL